MDRSVFPPLVRARLKRLLNGAVNQFGLLANIVERPGPFWSWNSTKNYKRRDVILASLNSYTTFRSA